VISNHFDGYISTDYNPYYVYYFLGLTLQLLTLKSLSETLSKLKFLFFA